MRFTDKDAKELRKVVSAADTELVKLRGQNDRLRGQVKRLTARAEEAEKLAEARLKTIGRLDARKGLKV